MPSLPTLLAVFSFLWGAIWGSFLNVVIWRLPRGESLLTPPSHCPQCGKVIRWYQNVPILSYVALGGRCAGCRTPISVRYPLVELATAMLSLAAWQSIAHNPWVPSLPVAIGIYAFHFVFIAALVAITFIDLDTMLIPDVISLPMIAVGLAYGLAVGQVFGVTWLDSVIGAVAGAGIIAAVILGYLLLTGQEGMGWGDAKLMAFLGAFLGWKALPFILLVGSLQGLLYAGVTLAVGAELPVDPDDEDEDEDDEEEEEGEDSGDAAPPQPSAGPPEGGHEIAEHGGGADAPAVTPARSVRKLKVPFGPFLGLAALEWLFFSNWLVDWFQAIFRL
jgi:leader peptidase (prepilin peptidase)/N-methyltransferase